ncbi:MAG: Tetratricopeptide repeat protein [Mucilaginibacter sp.]|jgi:tetratricopeptide (TPR) repeat protein|nr:Tetratricopeptide repeat protein [Mucilaginibacter sp.]
MKKSYPYIIFLLFVLIINLNGFGKGIAQDTNEVVKLNTLGFKMRLTDPEQTVADAAKALVIAQKLEYTDGIGESYRVMGIGYYYLDQAKKAIDAYLIALNYFKLSKNIQSEAKVDNNIGNLYHDIDYDRALEFFQKSLVIATQLNDKQLTAALYLNIGTIYLHKKSLYKALQFYNKSESMFAVLKDSDNLVQCMQNKGVIYYSLNQFDIAKSLLLAANKRAKELDLNRPVASIDLTLADIYIAQNKFSEADKTIIEGIVFSKIIKNEKIQTDFKYTSYQLEVKRKNYEKALFILKDIYHQDSLRSAQGSSTQIFNLFKEQVNQQARQRENEIILQRQQYDRVKFWGVAIVAGLLLVLVGVLINNVKRKARTNIQLTNLNAEVSRQKDNLDRINHHLEEIIDERTKDLQIKNKKLSEYSSYLSHQIRGPIATLKGLLNLEKEGLVDQPECIKMMNKSVSEIDDKIIEMSDMLHDPGRAGF